MMDVAADEQENRMHASLRTRSSATLERVGCLILLMWLAALSGVVGGEPARSVLKSESFDRDPGWEAHNNRIVPKAYPTIVQDFGYSKTNVAGKAAGELGGQVWRASEPAYYADKIGPLTLDQKLSATG